MFEPFPYYLIFLSFLFRYFFCSRLSESFGETNYKYKTIFSLKDYIGQTNCLDMVTYFRALLKKYPDVKNLKSCFEDVKRCPWRMSS